MKPRVAGVVLVPLLLAGCFTERSLPRYDLSEAKARVGDTLYSREERTFKDAEFTTRVEGWKTFSIKQTTSETQVRRSRVLEAENGEATKWEIFYELETTELVKTTEDGKTESSHETGPLQGFTVLCNLENGIWKKLLKSEEPTPQQKLKLKDEKRAGSSIYPSYPVAMGESWQVPLDAFGSMTGGQPMNSGTATATLVRIEECDGEKCAVTRVNLKTSGSQATEGGQLMDVVYDVEGTEYRSLKSRILLKGEMSGIIKGSGSRMTNGRKCWMSFSSPISVTRSEAAD
jgi:hypothetical protein